MKKNITKILIGILIVMIGIMGIGKNFSYAMQDYSGNKALSLTLSYFRYTNGAYGNGYALNTITNETNSVKYPSAIYQIMNGTKTNYYCLNALAGDTWLNNPVGTSATYNRSYDLDSESDIALIKNDSTLPDVYRNIATSSHLKQILWILDNMYISNTGSTEQENLAQKREALAKAGIVYGNVDNTEDGQNFTQGYRYIAQEGYDYSAHVDQGKKGYFYYDKNDEYHIVELPDEMMEVASQAAIWYFTNYLENNEDNSTRYNVKDQWLPLRSSNQNTDMNTSQWPILEGNTFNVETNVSDVYAEVGKWQQEQVAVYCQYLIDAANKYAESTTSNTAGAPVSITPEKANITQKKVANVDYYVVGPIKIEKQRESVFSISNIINVNGSENKNAYICDETGAKKSDQEISNYIGQNFYVAVPKSSVTGSNVRIGFEGTYKTNEKTLWITVNGNTEQPVVEVTPKNQPFDLEVNSEITDITVNKIWKDYNNKENTRKEYAVTLTGKVGTQTVYTDTQTLQANVTTYTWTGLAKYYNGQEITYTVDETTVPEKYTKTVSGYTITNTYTTTTEISGTKTWVDDNNSGNTRPTKIKVYLVKNGTRTNTYQEVTAANGWKYSFTNLDKYDENNNLISYSVEEENVVGYETSYNGNNITNKLKNIDFSLRKIIKQLTDSEGKTKLITNEAGNLATRKITYVASNIATEGTAIYNHRKDPVVVEKGDRITYELTIYNEGEVSGYASEVTDKLPEGLKLYGAKTGTYSSGNVKYSYVYDETKNTITFTNASKNILTPYDGKEELSSETIQVECEVTENATASSNTYLTNIAYISKEHNSEIDTDITKDRDSETTNIPSAEQKTTGDKYTGYHGGDNKNGNNDKDVYKDGLNNNDYFPGREDDDDFEVVVIKPAEFDLALQKYISSIYSKGKENAGRKGPTIDTTKLASKEETTATYTQDKTPIAVKRGDYVTYTFTVYNEGEADGYVTNITDNIPTGVQFVYPKQPADGKTLITCDSEGKSEEITVSDEIYKLVTKNNSAWSIDQKDGKLLTDTYNGETTTSVTCDVASYLGGTNKLLKSYDSSKDTNNNGDGLDRVSVTVVLRVSADDGIKKTIRNEAAITGAEDSNGNKQDITNLKDRDSETNQWPGKDGDKKYQDDEDYDNIILGNVDLALTKFITAVSNDTKIEDGEYLTGNGKIGSKENPYLRATKVETKELRDNEECHDATYIMVKDPLTVPAKSYVLYNIRVYNEGETDVYAGEITDHLPDYLDYVDCEFNTEYGWKVGTDGKTIKTTYLGYDEKDTEAKNLLKAFDKAKDDGEGSGLDYRDVQVLCRVNDNAPSNTNIVNVAEITKYEDPDGDDIPKDIDSTPDNVDKKNEDDDDYEVIKIKTFDLSLLKYVSTVYVTEDGKTTTTQTGNTGDDKTDKIPKVEVNKKKLDSTVVKFGYTIKITNEGDIEGYAKEITDYVPEGLKFYAEDNNGWTDEGNNVISTRLLENTLLKPGESAQVTVILRWINGSKNLGLKTNIAEISEDYNEDGVPDRDSTPDNQDPGEDDIDDASVMLSIKTGIIGNIAKYVVFGSVIMVIFVGGIVLIKKYVL